MDTSKIASWGSREDRPERDEMRALLIGHAFMAMYRATQGGKKEQEDRWVVQLDQGAKPRQHFGGCGAASARSRTSTGKLTPKSQEN